MELWHSLAFMSAILSVNAGCTSRNYTATTFPTFVENINYENNENCEFNIIPKSKMQYYLEITMHKFVIQGRMPDCEGDYLEFFITRSQISIGKYCSLNTHNGPFTIYSADGYAKVRFSSNASHSDVGFQFSFELRPLKETLGSSNADDCIKSYTVEHTTVLHSTGWPIGYAATVAKCEHVVANAGKQEVQIVIMDIDVTNRAGKGCDVQDDYIQIKGENEKKEMKLITQKLCKNNGLNVFRTRYSPIYIEFYRKRGSGSSHRGYVIGVKTFDFKPGTTSPDNIRNAVEVIPNERTGRPRSAASIKVYYLSTIVNFFMLVFCIVRF